jgi:hypothetical protein
VELKQTTYPKVHTTMTTTTDILNEAKEFFVNSYVEELTDRLNEAAAEDELETVLDDDGIIDGSLLCSVDMNAYNATVQNYGWRVDSDELREAVAGPEIYEGIDYAAIIAKARETANA